MNGQRPSRLWMLSVQHSAEAQRQFTQSMSAFTLKRILAEVIYPTARKETTK
jgi:hypothetical protein